MLALLLAYSVYVALFRLPFFPTLNLTGAFVCIAIGADDVFIFLQARGPSLIIAAAHRLPLLCVRLPLLLLYLLFVLQAFDDAVHNRAHTHDWRFDAAFMQARRWMGDT